MRKFIFTVVFLLLTIFSFSQAPGSVVKITDANTAFTKAISVGTYALNVADTIPYVCKKYAYIGLTLRLADTCFERLQKMQDTVYIDATQYWVLSQDYGDLNWSDTSNQIATDYDVSYKRTNGIWQQEIVADADNGWTVSFILQATSIISYNGTELPVLLWSGIGTTVLTVSFATLQYDKITIIR